MEEEKNAALYQTKAETKVQAKTKTKAKADEETKAKTKTKAKAKRKAKAKTKAKAEEENPGNSTIFDDVFRTIAQKLPHLLVPLINEVFGTLYSEEQEFEQLRNEHYEKFGKVVTDSIIRIEGHTYHIECQSDRDGSMAVRMMEYDFAIALEQSSLSDDGKTTMMKFPESCVLYIRNHRDMPKYHEVQLYFADGNLVVYRVPVILAQKYSVNHIFEKRLLILLPYHILRYEAFLKSNSMDEKKMEELLEDYREINRQLSGLQDGDGRKGQLYADMIDLINRIADYIIPRDNPSRKRIGEIMGGKVLQLESERLREEGIKKGKAEGIKEGKAEGIKEGKAEGIKEGMKKGMKKGRILEIYSMVQDGDISPECAAKRLGITAEELKGKMEHSGYPYLGNERVEM